MITPSYSNKRHAAEFWRFKLDDSEFHELALHTARPVSRQTEHEIRTPGYARLKVSRSPGMGWGIRRSSGDVFNVFKLKFVLHPDKREIINYLSIGTQKRMQRTVRLSEPVQLSDEAETHEIIFEPNSLIIGDDVEPAGEDTDNTISVPAGAYTQEHSRATASGRIVYVEPESDLPNKA